MEKKYRLDINGDRFKFLEDQVNNLKVMAQKYCKENVGDYLQRQCFPTMQQIDYRNWIDIETEFDIQPF